MARTVKEYVIHQAEKAHRMYPQYEGHWRGPEWKFARIKRRVRTKLGIAFEPGEATIVRRHDHNAPGFVTAYSVRNRVDTSVREAWVEMLEA